MSSHSFFKRPALSILNSVLYFLTTDKKGQILSVSPNLQVKLGLKRSSIIGKPIHSFLSKLPNEAFLSGTQWQADLCFVRKSQKPIWIDMHVTPLRRSKKSKSAGAYLWFGTDISRHKQYEEAIQQTANIGVFVISSLGELTYLSEHTRKLLEVKQTQIENDLLQTIGNSILPIDRERVRQTWKLFIEGSLEFDVEFRIRTSRGERWLSVKASFLKNPEGKSAGYLGTLLDVTDQKHIEERLLKAQSEALSSVKAKSEFLANMSHEIRTPMNAIIGMADLLAESPLNPEQRRYVDIFRRAGNGLLDIINDILDLSKIDSGHLHLEHTVFSVKDLVDDINDLLLPRATDQGLELVWSIHRDAPESFWGDPTRLRQVLVNLISNAIKFTPNGMVKVELLPNTQSQTKGSFLFSVSDTGIGISENQIEQLFQPFIQADSTITRKFGGTGLGLSICKKIVDLMKGEIWATSIPGKGSTFSFTAQLVPEKTIGDLNSSSALSTDLSDQRILLIEQSHTNRMVIQEMLGHQGGKLETCLSMFEAQSKLFANISQQRTYNSILIDSKTIGRSDLLSFLKQLHLRHPNTTVIMLSSDSPSPEIADTLTTLHVPWLLKPFKRLTLLRALTKSPASTLVRASPLNRAEASRGTTPPKRQGLRILVVDDSDENRMLIRAYLKNSSHILDEVDNGKAAFNKIRAQSYDLVFMDMQMPILDGYRATEMIRKWEQENHRNRTPIIALTAYALKTEQDKSYQSGCDHHLSKPIKKSVLLAAIDRFALADPSDYPNQKEAA